MERLVHTSKERWKIQLVSNLTPFLKNLKWSNISGCNLSLLDKPLGSSLRRDLEIHGISNHKGQVMPTAVGIALLVELDGLHKQS